MLTPETPWVEREADAEPGGGYLNAWGRERQAVANGCLRMGIRSRSRSSFPLVEVAALR